MMFLTKVLYSIEQVRNINLSVYKSMQILSRISSRTGFEERPYSLVPEVMYIIFSQKLQCLVQWLVGWQRNGSDCGSSFC
jgi:hypothetical protein